MYLNKYFKNEITDEFLKKFQYKRKNVAYIRRFIQNLVCKYMLMC